MFGLAPRVDDDNGRLGYLDCVFRSGGRAVEAEHMRDALFQLFFVLASAYAGIRVVDDVKWVRERKLARVDG